MPKELDPHASLGRTYRGESAPPITTPEAVATDAAERAKYDKPGAVALHVYFVTKGIDSPIMKASMSGYTSIRAATIEDFDKIFDKHHNVVEEKKP